MTLAEHRARLNACANYIKYAQEHKVSGSAIKRDALDCARIAAQAVSEHGLECKYDQSASGTDPGMPLALALASCIEWAVDCDNTPVKEVGRLRRNAAQALHYAGIVIDRLEGK